MSETLSDDEFHRMQLQLIEMRTENYKLKDENKKQAMKIKELTDKEIRLDKELNKQVKMKKALSTLNKSKQAQEYEALLQQTEQEFALQSQTLMQELTNLTMNVEKLEKENQQMKRHHTYDSASDSEFRRLQAENKALKSNIEHLQVKHKEEVEKLSDSMKQTSLSQSLSNCTQSTDEQLNDPLSVHAKSSLTDGDDNVVKKDESTTSQSTDVSSSAVEERLLHAEAQCERLKQQLREFQGIQIQFETEKEEKLLLQTALDDERSRNTREHRALSSEVEAFREKLDRKQTLYISLQEEKEKLIAELKAKSSEMSLLRETMTEEVKEDREKLQNEINSLGSALQTAHNLLEKQQDSMDNLQTQSQLLEQDKTQLVEENNRLKDFLKEKEQDEKHQEHKRLEHSSQVRTLEEKVRLLEGRVERAVTEKDDAVTKFEENARASGALLQRVDQVEQESDSLKRELANVKELAERRKKVMDKQAVDSQESNAKYTEQLTSMKQEYEATLKHTQQNYDDKIKALESTCKRQEKELIRMNHQDRTKTREIDSCQQQLRDVQAAVSSLENSKGWFERALKDAEEAAKKRDEAHLLDIEEIKAENLKELESIKVRLSEKDDVIAEYKKNSDDVKDELVKRDEEIETLKQEIKDEVSKQRLVEKKGHASLKDLKRQLLNERKRNEKLQEKLGEISSSNSNLDELLQVVDPKEEKEGSSVSSFSFRDFISPNKQNSSESTSQGGSSGPSNTKTLSSNPNTSSSVTKAESKDLLSRITTLQQEKWNLEEKVRHLEESAGAMADELLEKTKMLQQYVHHTRTDHHKPRSSNEELGSRKFTDRMLSIITGQEEPDINNIRELNRKLTRMLEEEMTKNVALKQDLANLSQQLSAKN